MLLRTKTQARWQDWKACRCRICPRYNHYHPQETLLATPQPLLDFLDGVYMERETFPIMNGVQGMEFGGHSLVILGDGSFSYIASL